MKITRNSLLNGGLVLTVLLLTYSGFSYLRQVSTINKLTEQYLWQVNASIRETTRNYLLPAQLVSELSSQLAGSGVLSLSNPDMLQAYVSPISMTYPQLQGFYVGTEADEFWFWLKQPKPEVDHAVQHIKQVGGQRSETWRYFDSENHLLSEQTNQQVSYQPTSRPWYRGAKQLQSGFWTDVYLFNTKKTPGITGSYPIFNPGGEVKAVWGVDIEIGELSRFLADISVAQLGEIAILNGNGQVIAYSGYLAQKQRSLNLPTLDDLGSQALSDTVQNFNNHGFGHFFVRSQGVPYLASVSPFNFPNEQNWQIVIAIPEDKLLGDLLWSTRFNGIVMFFMVAAGFALLLLLRRNFSPSLPVPSDN